MIHIRPRVHDAIKSLNEKLGNNYDADVLYPIETEAEYLTNCRYVVGEDENKNALFSETPQYTWDQISTELGLLRSDFDNKEYQRTREVNYPSIQEQLDLQYWDKINGTNTWQEAISKVKSDTPKPEGD